MAGGKGGSGVREAVDALYTTLGLPADARAEDIPAAGLVRLEAEFHSRLGDRGNEPN